MTLYGDLISRERGGEYPGASRPENVEKFALVGDEGQLSLNNEVRFWLKRGLCLESALIMAGLKRPRYAGFPLVRGE